MAVDASKLPIRTPEEDAAYNANMEACMMADLGRHRQEELPLHDGHHRNYEYRPRPGGYQASRVMQNRLANAWGNPVRDEESERLDGLTIEGAPWRQGRQPHVQTQTITRATARPMQVAPKPMRDNTVPLVAARWTPAAAPAAAPMAAPASARAGAPVATRAVTATTPRASARIVSTPVASNTSSPVVAPVTTPVSKDPKEFEFTVALEQARAECSLHYEDPPETYVQQKIFWGIMLVRPSLKTWIKVSWRIVLCNEPGKPISARLLLEADGLETRDHNITKLNAPYVDEDKKCCVLASSGPIADHSYYVQLRDDEQTKEFMNCLFGLQDAVHKAKSQTLLGVSAPVKTPSTRSSTRPKRVAVAPPPVVEYVGPESPTHAETIASTPPTRVESVTAEALISVEPTAPADTAPVTQLVELDNSEQTAMDLTKILEAIAHLDAITDVLATRTFNPQAFDLLDAISKDYYLARHPGMDASSRLGLATSIQDMIKRQIGIKQREMIYEPGPKLCAIPEAVKEFTRPITYSKKQLEALRSKGYLPELEEETMSPGDAKVVWRYKDEKKGMESSRWSGSEK